MLDVENTEGGKAIDFFAKFRLRIYTPKKKKKKTYDIIYPWHIAMRLPRFCKINLSTFCIVNEYWVN